MLGTYDKILYFYDTNYTIAISGNKTGLIDVTNGCMITDFIYDLVDDKETSEDWDAIYELIGRKYEPENKDYFVLERCIARDYCVMRKNTKWGLLNSKGKVVIDFKYDNEIELCSYPDPNYYIITVDNKNGRIDLKSNILMEPKFDWIHKCGDEYWVCEFNENLGACIEKQHHERM